MNDQRKVIYEQRREIMQAADVADDGRRHAPRGGRRDGRPRASRRTAYAEQWDIDGLHEEVLRILGLDLPVADWAKEEGIADERDPRARSSDAADAKMAAKAANYGAEIDAHGREEPAAADPRPGLEGAPAARSTICARASACAPTPSATRCNEYKREAFELFERCWPACARTVTQVLAQVELRVTRPEDVEAQQRAAMQREMHESRFDPALGVPPEPEMATAAGAVAAASAALALNPDWVHTPRNAPCPCGSGKKFKHCHGTVV